MEFGPAMSPYGNTRPREHDANPNLLFLASGPLRLLTRKHKNPLKLRPTYGRNPTVLTRRSPRWTVGCAMSPSGDTSPRLSGPLVSSCGNTRPREHDSSPNPQFQASGPPHSLAETRKKPPSLLPKNVQHRRRQPVGSLVGHLGLQCPPPVTPILGALGL